MKKFYFLAMFLSAALFLNAQTSVTFSVDMNGIAEFTPGTDVMKIGGDFQGWNPDDSVMDDSDGDGIWTYTTDIPAGTILFKFVINAWETNEFHPDTPGTPGDCTVDDGSNINRSEDIPDQASYALPIYVYNSCDISPLNVNNLSTISDVTIAPNPANDFVNITYTNPNNVNHDIMVTSLTGQIVAQFNNIAENNLRINTEDFAAGMYFVTFRNEKGEQGSEKLVIRR